MHRVFEAHKKYSTECSSFNFHFIAMKYVWQEKWIDKRYFGQEHGSAGEEIQIITESWETVSLAVK